jgi:hypothetical protein
MADWIRRAGVLDELVPPPDWLLDAELAAPDQVNALIEDLTTFYFTVRRGIPQP